MHVVNELAKSMLQPVERSHPKDVEPVFSECASLVEATYIDLPAYIDTSGRDAKDPELAETTNRKAGTDGQSGRKSWRNDDRDQVQSTENDRVPSNL